jgi:hypothetical protein
MYFTPDHLIIIVLDILTHRKTFKRQRYWRAASITSAFDIMHAANLNEVYIHVWFSRSREGSPREGRFGARAQIHLLSGPTMLRRDLCTGRVKSTERAVSSSLSLHCDVPFLRVPGGHDGPSVPSRRAPPLPPHLVALLPFSAAGSRIRCQGSRIRRRPPVRRPIQEGARIAGPRRSRAQPAAERR